MHREEQRTATFRFTSSSAQSTSGAFFVISNVATVFLALAFRHPTQLNMAKCLARQSHQNARCRRPALKRNAEEANQLTVWVARVGRACLLVPLKGQLLQKM